MKRLAPVLLLSCSSHTMPAPDPVPVSDPPAVLTQHNDNLRTGANLRETILTPRSVTQESFQLVFSRSVRGYIYAQPLFVPGLEVGGRKHDVVFVCTEHNDVYAFDANDPMAGEPLWHVNLGTPVTSQHLDV